MRKRILEVDHLDISNSLENLAVTLANKNDFINAEIYQRECYEMR
jgi:hypothetical protein